MGHHILDRLWERYGIEAQYSDVADLQAAAKKGLQVRKWSDRRGVMVRIVLASFKGQAVLCALRDGVLVTVLPREAVCTGRHRSRKRKRLPEDRRWWRECQED